MTSTTRTWSRRSSAPPRSRRSEDARAGRIRDRGLRRSRSARGARSSASRASRALAVMRGRAAAGITFLDDARYDDETGSAPLATGYSEVLFGELAARGRARPGVLVLANKLWWEFWPGQSALRSSRGRSSARGSTTSTSSTRCPRRPGSRSRTLVREMARLIDSGKVRAWGVAELGPRADRASSHGRARRGAAAAMRRAAPATASSTDPSSRTARCATRSSTQAHRWSPRRASRTGR